MSNVFIGLLTILGVEDLIGWEGGWLKWLKNGLKLAWLTCGMIFDTRFPLLEV